MKDRPISPRPQKRAGGYPTPLSNTVLRGGWGVEGYPPPISNTGNFQHALTNDKKGPPHSQHERETPAGGIPRRILTVKRYSRGYPVPRESVLGHVIMNFMGKILL